MQARTILFIAPFVVLALTFIPSTSASPTIQSTTTTFYFPLTPTPPPNLELREIVVDQGGHTFLETQYPTKTTNWAETCLPNRKTTWVPVTYTQTFPKVPDQLPGPGMGRIGTEKPVLAETVTTGGVERVAMGRWVELARVGMWVVFGVVIEIGL